MRIEKRKAGGVNWLENNCSGNTPVLTGPLCTAVRTPEEGWKENKHTEIGENMLRRESARSLEIMETEPK